MLSKLIPHIDTGIAELNYFKTLHGLAEKIRPGGDKEEEFPAVFKGRDNYTQIDLEKLACYHRMYDDRTFVEIPAEDVWGCDKAFEMTYPMKLVGCLKHAPGCETYEADTVANAVGYKIYQTRFGPQIRREIKAFSIEIFLKSIITDFVKVWEAEYKNVAPSMTFDRIYFEIKYDIKIKGSSSCLNIPIC